MPKSNLSHAAASMFFDGRHGCMTSLPEAEETIRTVGEDIKIAKCPVLARASFRHGWAILDNIAEIRDGCPQTQAIVDGLRDELVTIYSSADVFVASPV